MIDWYVEISEDSPETFKDDKYLSKVIETASPCMDYFCNRLSELEDWKLEEAESIFTKIIEELPIMKPIIIQNEFTIRYNNWTTIKLTDTTKQIYRESKIRQILS